MIVKNVPRETLANRGSGGKLVYRHFRGAARWLRWSKHAIASVATGCLHTGMTEASGKGSEGVPKGQMTVAQFLEMTADDRKVVR